MVAKTALKLTHLLKYRTVGELRILVAVCGHVVYGLHFICHTRQVGSHLHQVAAAVVVYYPVADVVQA